MFLKTMPRRNSFKNALLGVYFVKQINLDMYMTTKEDLVDGFQIRPEDTELEMLNYLEFKKRLKKLSKIKIG